MTTFQYHPDVLDRFPNIAGGIIVAHGLRNGPTPEPLRVLYAREQAAVVARIGDTPLSEIDALAAWRAAFRAFGVDPTQYRSAAEALLRRLTKKGDIPGINTLVDIGNLVSIRYGLPVAVFDLRGVDTPITVRVSDGTEPFTNLGQAEVAYPEPGEVVFTDATGAVAARRWCWRQSDESAAREDTTAAVITVEALHSGGCAAVEAALADLLSLLDAFAGGRFESAVLGVERPSL